MTEHDPVFPFACTCRYNDDNVREPASGFEPAPLIRSGLPSGFPRK
jgi:hypothetical protein